MKRGGRYVHFQSLIADHSSLSSENPYHLEVTSLKTGTPTPNWIKEISPIGLAVLDGGSTVLLEARQHSHLPKTGDYAVRIDPYSRNFSIGAKIPFTFEFTIKHPHLMRDITDFKLNLSRISIIFRRYKRSRQCPE